MYIGNSLWAIFSQTTQSVRNVKQTVAPIKQKPSDEIQIDSSGTNSNLFWLLIGEICGNMQKNSHCQLNNLKEITTFNLQANRKFRDSYVRKRLWVSVFIQFPTYNILMNRNHLRPQAVMYIILFGCNKIHCAISYQYNKITGPWRGIELDFHCNIIKETTIVPSQPKLWHLPPVAAMHIQKHTNTHTQLSFVSHTNCMASPNAVVQTFVFTWHSCYHLLVWLLVPAQTSLGLVLSSIDSVP